MAVGLHLGLGHGSTVVGGRGLGLGTDDLGVGIAVRAGTVVRGHAAVIGVARDKSACKVGIGDVFVLGVATNTANVVAGDLARHTAVFDVGARVVGIVRTDDATDVVAASALDAGVDDQAVTDIDGTAATGHAGDGAHHTLGFDDGVHHHQRVNRAGVLDTAEKTSVEIAALVAVEVVNAVAMAVEVAAEAVAGRGRFAGGRGITADGHPVVGAVAGVVEPEVVRQVQRLAVEIGAAVHQLRHACQLLRCGEVKGGLRSVVPRDVRGTVPNRLGRHRGGRKS